MWKTHWKSHINLHQELNIEYEWCRASHCIAIVRSFNSIWSSGVCVCVSFFSIHRGWICKSARWTKMWYRVRCNCICSNIYNEPLDIHGWNETVSRIRCGAMWKVFVSVSVCVWIVYSVIQRCAGYGRPNQGNDGFIQLYCSASSTTSNKYICVYTHNCVWNVAQNNVSNLLFYAIFPNVPIFIINYFSPL